MALRILSAFVGIVIGVIVLLLDNLYLYLGVVSFLSVLAVWELIRAVRCVEHKVLSTICVLFSAVFPWIIGIEQLKPFSPFVFILFIFCIVATLLKDHAKLRFEQLCMSGASAFLIPLSISCILFVRYSMPDDNIGISMVFYFLFCAWFGDSGAYFVGTFFGKHKLCPTISPKKTVEGFFGGIVTVGIVAFIHCLIFNAFFAAQAQMNSLVLVPVAMLASAAGVLGDLAASVIKRQYDVKDFGNIMPGHGGILDRFDSVLFVSPFLFLVFSFISPAM